MSILRSTWVWGPTIICVECRMQLRSGDAYFAVHQGLLDDIAIATVIKPKAYHPWCLDSINLVLGLVEDETLCITYVQS